MTGAVAPQPAAAPRRRSADPADEGMSGPSPRRTTMRRTALFALLPVPFAVNAQAPPAAGEVARLAAEALTANRDPEAPGMAVLVARGDDVLYRGACGRAVFLEVVDAALALAADTGATAQATFRQGGQALEAQR